MLRDGRRLNSLQLEEITEEEETVERTIVSKEVVLKKSAKSKKRVGHLLRPSAAGNLLLHYGCQGIGWEPRLSVEILEGVRVSVTLTAQINNGALDLSGCHIQLASGAGQLPSRLYFAEPRYAGNPNARSADLLYEVGRHTVAKDRPVLLTVRSAQSRYQEKLIWHTDRRDWARVVLG